MRRPRPPRSLRGRLTSGLVVLLALACLAVGVSTVLAVRGFLVGRIDQQLTASQGRFAASLEHERHPDADNRGDTRGQATGTFGARLLRGSTTQAAVVRDGGAHPGVRLSPSDRRALAGLPVDGTGHEVRLSSLHPYRMMAVAGDDGDVLVTGLPLRPVEDTLHRLELAEAAVFAVTLGATALAGALWIRASLRPLGRVARAARAVTRLPLASGEVDMPAPVREGDPATEVGQVAAAMNRMLGHVGDALARRHAVEERLRHFAADASHELRTPVATVRAHAEHALRHPEPLPHEVRHALERVQSESERMSVLVDDLLLLARLDAGRPLAREPVDLTLLVIDAVADARALSPDHRWRMDLPSEPVTARGDGDRLHQVVANLLANARTHTPAGTTVTTTLTVTRDEVDIEVADDGPGVPEELRPEVFERFTRADPSRTRRGGGTGLGLAIVSAVTAAHGGHVAVSSRPGDTRFRVRLPLGGPEA